MKQRPMSLEYGRKNVQPQQVRQVSSEAGPESESFDTVVQGLKSKLQTLEDKYSSLTNSVPRPETATSHEQSLSIEPSEADLPLKETDVTGSAHELFRRLSDLISSAQTKVLGLCSARTRLTEAEVKGRLLEEFAQLSNGVWDLTFRHKLKTEAPLNFKEWMRKILRLEDEKRAIEVLHKETIEKETRQLKEQMEEYENELTHMKETNAFLEDQVRMLSDQLAIKLNPSKAEIRKALSTHPIHQELNESIPKALAIARDLSLDSSVSSIDAKHSRKSSGSFIVDPRMSPVSSVSKEKEKDKSLSQFDRHIHTLKVELEKCREALKKCVKERDVLKAWKDSYQRNPPNLIMAIQQKELENEHERKRLTGKALILQHKLNAVLLSVQKFIRVSSNLLKSARDRDLVSQFENSRADLEVVIREVQKEEGKGLFLNTGSTPSRESSRNVSSVTPEKLDLDKVIRMLESENKRLEDDLRMERERADTFAEALELTHKQVEALSGVAFNPVLYLQQQDQLIKQLQEQVRLQTFFSQTEELSQTKSVLEEVKQLQEQNDQLRKEGKIGQDQVQLLRSSNNRLMQDLVAVRNELTAVTQVCQTGIQALATMMDQRCQRILEDISQKDQSLSKLKSAVLDRFQEQLRSLIQINDMMSKSSPGEEVDMELLKKLLEEKTHLEFMLQQNQDWSSYKISELQEQLDQANQVITDLQTDLKGKDSKLQEFALLMTQVKAAESSTAHQQELEKDLLKLRTEMATEASFWKKKELEFQELLYEKNRLEGKSQELMESAKNRAADWILAEETFQKTTAEANRRIEEMEVERQRVQQEKNQLEKEVTSLQDELEAAQQEVIQMRISQIQLEKQVGERLSSSLAKRKEKLKAAKSESSDQIAKLNKELIEMSELLTESQALNASKTGEVERLSQTVAQLSLYSEEVRSRYHAEREKLSVEIKAAQTEVEKAKEDGESVRTSLDSERVRVAGLTSELTSTMTQVQDSHRKLDQLSRDLAVREEENAVALVAIEGLKSRLEVSAHERETSIQRVKVSLTQELSEQKMRIFALEEENQALKNRLIIAEDQAKGIESELKSREQTHSELLAQAKEEFEALTSSKSVLQLANDHQGLEIQRMTGENRELRERLDKLMTDLKAQQKDKSLTVIITQLQRQLDEKTQEVMELKQLRQAKEIAMNQHFLAFDQVKREVEEGNRNREIMQMEMRRVQEEKQELLLQNGKTHENEVKLQQELETIIKNQRLEATRTQHLAEEQSKSLSGLQSQLSAKTDEMERVKKFSSELQQKVLQTESELQQTQRELNDTATRLQAEKQALERRISTLEKEKSAALIEEKNNRDVQNRKLKEAQSCLEEELRKETHLQELIAEKQELCKELGKRLESAMNKVQTLEDRTEAQNDEIARIRREKTEFEDESNRFRELSQVINGKLDTCLREKESKDAQISAGKASLLRTEEQLHDLQVQFEAVKTHFDTVNNSAVLREQELKDTLEKTHTEVANLKEKLAGTETVVERLKQEIEQKSEELLEQISLGKTLRSELSAMQREHSQLVGVNQELQSNLEIIQGSATSQYQTEHKKRLSTEKLLQESNQSLHKLEVELHTLSKKLQDQEHLLASQHNDLISSHAETQSLQSSLHMTEIQLREQVEKLARATQLLSEKSTESDSLAQKIRTTEHTLIALRQQIQLLEDTETKAKDRIATLEHECKVHSETHAKLSEVLETKARTADNEQKELLGHLGKAQELLKGKESELQKCYLQIESVASELKATEAALETEQGNSAKLERLKEELGKELSLLHNALQDSNSKLDLESGKFASQGEENAALKRSITLTETSLREIQGKFESAQRELERMKSSAVLKEKELKDALQQAHAEELSLSDELSRTEDQVKSLKQETVRTNDELVQQISLVQKLQHDLSVGQKEHRQIQETLQSKLKQEQSAHASVTSQYQAEHEQRLFTEKSLQASNESLHKLEVELHTLSKKLQDQEHLLASQHNDLISSQAETQSFQSSLHTTEIQLREQDEKLAKVTQLLSEKSAESDSLAQKIRTTEHTSIALRQQIQLLEDTETKAKDRIATLEQERKVHSETHAKLSEVLETKARTADSEMKELLEHLRKSQELLKGKESELLKCYLQIESVASELKATEAALETERGNSAKLERLKEELGKELSLLHNALQDSNSKLDLESGKLASQGEENAALKRSITLTETSLREIQGKFESAQRELERTKSSAVLKEKELKDALQQAHSEGLSLRDELSRTEDQVKSLKQETVRTNEELVQQISLVQKLQHDLSVGQKEHRQIQETLQSKLEQEQSAHTSATSQYQAEHEQRLFTEKSLQASNESLHKLEEEVNTLSKKLQDQARLLTSQHTDLVNSERETQSLQSSLQTAELKLEQLAQVEQINASQKLQIESLLAQIQSTVATHQEELLQARNQITTLDHIFAASKSSHEQDLSSMKSEHSRLIIELQELHSKAKDDLTKHQELNSYLKSENQRLENENAELKEEIRKLNSGDAEEPIITSPILDNISDVLHFSEEAKQTEGGGSMVGSPERRRTTNEPIDSEALIRVENYFSPQDSLLQDLSELLSSYRNPQEDLLTTVRKLLEELELMKKNKSGVVIPRLQLRSNRDSKESQTSERESLSVSMQEEPKGSEGIPEETPSSDALDKSIGASEEQDTPRQKILPELWKKRVSNEIRQVKTDEIGYLKTKVKTMEKELSEESSLKQHLEMQNRLLKEEVAEKDRQLKRAAVAETGGEKSPVNVEHLKDVLMNLIMLLSKQYLLLRSANVESLINTVYSLLFLSPQEVKQIETARVKGKSGFFSKLLK